MARSSSCRACSCSSLARWTALLASSSSAQYFGLPTDTTAQWRAMGLPAAAPGQAEPQPSGGDIDPQPPQQGVLVPFADLGVASGRSGGEAAQRLVQIMPGFCVNGGCTGTPPPGGSTSQAC